MTNINISNKLLEEIVVNLRKNNIQKIVVGAVITFGDKILLLERAATEFKAGLVELPSGGVEPDEDFMASLVREVKEETNLDVISIDKYIGHFDYSSSSGLNTRQLNFTVSVSSTDIKINPSEHSQYILISLADLNFQGLNISDEVLNIIKIAL
jgi:8-oxo-dGTP diphosphatase